MGIISDWMARNWLEKDRATKNAGLQTLLGARGQEVQGAPQPMMNGVLPEVVTYGGSGLMGGNGMFDPMNQARYASGLMQLPGGFDAGARSMENNFAGGRQLAWNREQLGSNQRFDAGQNQLTAAANLNEFNVGEDNAMTRARNTIGQNESEFVRSEQGRLERQRDDQIWQDENAQLGTGGYKGYKDLAQRNTQLNALADDTRTATAGNREALGRWNSTVDAIERVGGVENLTAADDMNLIRDSIKIGNPTEAIMTDDVILAKQAAGGLPAKIMGYLAELQGTGSIGKTGRQNLIDSMEGKVKSVQERNNQLRDFYGERAERGLFERGEVMPAEVQLKNYDKLKKVTKEPKAGQVTVNPGFDANVTDKKVGDAWSEKGWSFELRESGLVAKPVENMAAGQIGGR